MSEEPRRIWSRPWSGLRGWLLWYLLLTAGIFAVVFSVACVSNPQSVPSLIAFAFPVSLVIGLASMVFVKFIRWVCNWQNFRKFLFGVACFITLIFLAYAVENWRGKRAWENYKREWEAKGEKFAIADFAPSPVPDEKNFALTPLFADALNYRNRSQWLPDTNAVARLNGLRIDLRMPHSTNELALGRNETGELANLEVCRAFYRGNTNYPQPIKPGTAAEDILVALGRFDPELKELREAAANRPLSRFPIDYNHEPAFDILLPHVAQVKGLCQLLDLRAIARLDTDHPEVAMEDLKLAFRLSNAIKDEPILISHLVRLATVAINLRVIHEGLLRHAWSDAQLVELENYLVTLDLLVEYKLAMRGERAFNIGGLDYLRRLPFYAKNAEYSIDEDGHSVSTTTFNAMPGGWYYQNMLHIARLHQDYTVAAVNERVHQVSPKVCASFLDAIDHLPVGPYNVWARNLMPAMDKAALRTANHQFQLDAVRVVCAAERYRLANGKYPKRLDALVPTYINQLPRDVIDGQPLRYQTDAQSVYRIYSIGWNEKDDGGRLGWQKDRPKVPDREQGDWVWQMAGK